MAFEVQNIYSTPQIPRKRPCLRPRRMTLIDLRYTPVLDLQHSLLMPARIPIHCFRPMSFSLDACQGTYILRPTPLSLMPARGPIHLDLYFSLLVPVRRSLHLVLHDSPDACQETYSLSRPFFVLLTLVTWMFWVFFSQIYLLYSQINSWHQHDLNWYIVCIFLININGNVRLQILHII